MGKRLTAVAEKVDRETRYSFSESIALLKETASAKFDEAAEAVLRLNIDPKKNEHRIRGTVALPHGTGKDIRVCVIAKGEKVTEAEKAGADFVGGEELVEKIDKEGWLEFDRMVATPDMMSVVSSLGRVLGPRGLMPSPKSGTVTMDVGSAVDELKKGKLEFRVDEYGQIHCLFGRLSFEADKLEQNFTALAKAVFAEKPSDIKGRYVKSVSISSTMGPGIKIDPADLSRIVTGE